ncbi:response regulator [Roseateles noduli]|uniref:response regulator n=1 Tax=Roseateles noduli TaxID=2052484 RepID=UPI003D65EB92
MKIALVEDSAMLRRLMVSRLEQACASIDVVAQAATESAALGAIALSCPDTVLVDLHLQHGSGVGVIRSLRAMNFAGRIFVLSSEDRATYEPIVLGFGADGFYDKALDFETLINDLSNHARSSLMAN